MFSPLFYCSEKGGYGADDQVCLALVSQAHLPTRFGNFKISVFQNNRDLKEPLMLFRGKLDNAEALPVRIHSQCQTTAQKNCSSRLNMRKSSA